MHWILSTAYSVCKCVCVRSPFILCDFAVPPQEAEADCSVLPVFFDKPGTVTSSLPQTHVWSDCQPTKTHSLPKPHPHPLLPPWAPSASALPGSLSLLMQFEPDFGSPPLSTLQPCFHSTIPPRSLTHPLNPTPSTTRGYMIAHFRGSCFFP